MAAEPTRDDARTTGSSTTGTWTPTGAGTRARVILTALAVLGLAWASAGPARGEAVAVRPPRRLAFEANRGQVDERVRFLARGAGYTIFLAADEAILALRG